MGGRARPRGDSLQLPRVSERDATAEVIVVGAGTAGCVLARRLIDAGMRVLLLESGVGLGAMAIPALLPGFVAAAVGYLIFVGFGDWGGLNAPGLASRTCRSTRARTCST